MRTALIALLALCLCLPLAGAEKKTDVEKAGYKGRVKSVKRSYFLITEKFGEPVRESFESVTVAKYDEKVKTEVQRGDPSV